MRIVKIKPVFVYKGEGLARYNFGESHPFGPERHDAFHDELANLSVENMIQIERPTRAGVDQLVMFHTSDYIERVSRLSKDGQGFLDQGDTPAFVGVFEAASDVVGTTLSAVDAVMQNEARRAFVPIGGLHHAMRDKAGGFCVFNDCGIAIEYLRENYGIARVAYIDIDAHHGDGVFYSFKEDADLIFADIHQDGRTLYPGTGDSSETGSGEATGTKLNIPLPPGANDEQFSKAWSKVEDYLIENKPEFILLQCGADSLAGDPITQLALTESSHGMAALSLCKIADRFCEGRIVAMGGGGYNLENIAKAWTAVVKSFLMETQKHEA